jgi:hypothetical protein
VIQIMFVLLTVTWLHYKLRCCKVEQFLERLFVTLREQVLIL